jgi:RHS repeat-associated protein
VGYIYAGENPIARHTPSGTQYYLEDATDSVRALTNGTGAVSESYDYDGFGNVRSVDQPELGYHAAWHDPTSGLIDMRLREYDPQTGRFTSPDPIDPDPTIYESFNPYAFANQNPIVFSDPTGGFTMIEMNVSNLVQGTLKALKQAGIQKAKSEVFERINEAVFNIVLQTLSGLLPIDPALLSSGASKVAEINQGNNFEDIMQVAVCSALQRAGYPKWLYLFPGVDGVNNPARNQIAGAAYDDGIGCGGEGEVRSGFGGNRPRPDFILSPVLPTQAENFGDAYLIGDIKRSTRTIYDAYVNPGKQINQFRGITKFSLKRAYRVSAFFTLLSTKKTENALEQLAIREGVSNGLIVLIVTVK